MKNSIYSSMTNERDRPKCNSSQSQRKTEYITASACLIV